MKEYTTLLEEALEAWTWARRGVIDEVKNLADGDMAFRPNPKSRSGLELGWHIVEVGLMFCGELTRPDGDFRRQPYPKLIAEYARHVKHPSTKAEMVSLLETTHADGEKKLREAGELTLLQPIKRFDGKKGTRFAWLNHGIAHEEYHRGQIALYARLLGKVPALTKLIEGS